MVGRLARYLRFVGCDTEYVRGLTDDRVIEKALAEDRVILTRDRGLALRARRVLLLESTEIAEQFRAVRKAWPEVPAEVRFERCTECNGRLSPYRLGSDPALETGLPHGRLSSGLAVFCCSACGHLYWEGSHTARIRERLAAWARES
jgi:uncharacterized protein